MKMTTNDILIEPSIHGGLQVSFRTSDLTYNNDLMHKYSGKSFVVEIKQKKENRSLDANAYCWVLCGKIAEHKDIHLQKDRVYQQAIRDYGVSTIMPIRNDVLQDVLRWHTGSRLGNQYRVLGASKFEGYTNVCFYYGSSEYDTKQMSHLIDGIIADCKDLGIETMTPSELQRLKESWK